MKRAVILISGRGSNMQAILEARRAGTLPLAVTSVLSNDPAAKGLATATAHGVRVQAIDHRGFRDRAAFDAALSAAIDAEQPDIVVLAGFMRILTDGFVDRYRNRLINIHPSLLPAFTGLHTHRRALAAGVRLHGCTVHFVTPQLDHGPIVIQAAVPVLPGDTEDSLAARVLREEHRIYPQALRWFCEDRLQLRADGTVDVAGHPAGEVALIAPPLDPRG